MVITLSLCTLSGLHNDVFSLIRQFFQLMYLINPNHDVNSDCRDMADIVISLEMRDAGVRQLESLLDVVDSDFLVSQVYIAMVHADPNHRPLQKRAKASSKQSG